MHTPLAMNIYGGSSFICNTQTSTDIIAFLTKHSFRCSLIDSLSWMVPELLKDAELCRHPKVVRPPSLHIGSLNSALKATQKGYCYPTYD
jgi:hypothetical protein